MDLAPIAVETLRLPRVLFVDDDREVLAAFQRLLRKYRQRWDLTFALGGVAALEEVRRAPFDVVVTDMRMPEIDGAALLGHVRDRDPTTVCVILSGFSDRDAAARAHPVAHQFFDKPCDPKRLTAAIEQACRVRAMFADERLRAAFDRIGPLPPPDIYHELIGLLECSGVLPSAIAEVIERDPAIATRVMRYAQTRSIGEAVLRLGHEACAGLALFAHVLETLAASLGDLSVTRLEQRAFDAARQASPAAFTATLLHDLGLAVIEAGHLRDPRTRHAELGAYVLTRWCAPLSLVEAVGARPS